MIAPFEVVDVYLYIYIHIWIMHGICGSRFRRVEGLGVSGFRVKISGFQGSRFSSKWVIIQGCDGFFLLNGGGMYGFDRFWRCCTG